MSNELWKIVLKETFVAPDILFLLIVPVLAAIITIIVYKRSPLKSTGAWYNVGRRFLTLGCIFTGLSLVVYLLSISFAYPNLEKTNKDYSTKLQAQFRDYFLSKKNYTQRLIDFAQRIDDTKAILAAMDNFATNLPPSEREKFGRTWSASLHGGHFIKAGIAFQGIEDFLYWPEERVAQFKKENSGHSPGVAELRYTKEQIIEFKKSNWAKLYPMLMPEQWILIKNQILAISDREDVLGFLRDIADVFQTPDPTDSLNSLYEQLANKACPTEMQKIECYLEDIPKLFVFYKFSLQHRWWFRTLPIAIIFIIIGVIIIVTGNDIAANGKKKIFK